MSLDTHVAVTLRINNTGIARAGFGLAAILTYKTNFTRRIAYYNNYADLVADGNDADSPEALAASKLFAQSPHPTQVALIRGTRKPTQQYTVECSSVVDLEDYIIKAKGEGVTATSATYTSVASSNLSSIHTGLITALNAVVGKNFTAAPAALVYADKVFTAANASEIFTAVAHGLLTGDGPFNVSNSGGALPTGLAAVTDYWVIKIDADTFYLATSLANANAGTHLSISTDGTGVQTISDLAGTKRPSSAFTVTADAAGDWFSLEMSDRSLLSVSQTHADPGIGTDLSEINVVDSSWYALHTLYDSEACILGAAAWVEANTKEYIAATNCTECESTATTNGEIGDQINALGYKRTILAYHPNPAAMFGAGWEGRLLPLSPGKWTAAYKTIAGVEATTFTATQIVNLDARRMSYYKTEAGRNITWEGKVGNTDYGFLDVVVGLDWFLDDVKKAVFGCQVALDKVSYTDEDIALIAGAVEGSVMRGMSDSHDLIAKGTPGDPDDPEPTVVFPKVKDIDPSARALRNLPDGVVSFRLQGAVHSVTFDVTVSF